MSEKASFGVVGLGVMGESLALNAADKGYRVALMDLDPAKGEAMVARAEPQQSLVAAANVEELVAALERPRRILVMVPAGRPVDATLDSLRPHLEPGDLVIDGGNEQQTETERRQAALEGTGLHWLGMGVSGGQEGARHGPSLMPGGDKAAYRAVAPVLEAIAAKVDDGPCVTYIGPGGAGHYVKMVHNGIEYADMQLIAEIYDLLHHAGGASLAKLAGTFDAWNAGVLEGFLVEITARIFRQRDDRDPQAFLLDKILDTAKMKGTGSWTVRAGAELAVPIPTIGAAVEARLMSGLKPQRVVASEHLGGPTPDPSTTRDDLEAWLEDAEHALYAAKICAYAQGMGLLQAASEAYDWSLDLAEVSRIWKDGCIIRARLLVELQRSFKAAPKDNLLMGPLGVEVSKREAAWRRTVARCAEHGISVPGLGSALAYYDGYRRARLPANMTQAQRDLFGAHTYQRIDADGSFHTDWE